MAASFGYSSPEEALRCTTEIASQWYVDPRRRDELKRLLERDGRCRASKASSIAGMGAGSGSP